MLVSGGKPFKIYTVALGTEPIGAKQRQGDHKTPEGIYTIDSKNPQSEFHRALHLSYPNLADRERARRLGVSPGGDVEIHGLGAIDEIWPMVSVGTPVEIRP